MSVKPTVIPAAPGYLVVKVLFADVSAPAIVETHPVIAWRVEGDAVHPITLPVAGLDLSEPDANRGVFHPSGRVTSCGTEFTSLDVWLDERRAALSRASVNRAEAELL